MACCQCCDRQVLSTRRSQTMASYDTHRWKAAAFVVRARRRRSVYDKKLQRYAEDNKI